MAQVAIQINGRRYEIGCDDGQEDHVRILAGYVDDKVRQLVARLGQVGDARLLLMASLLIADEATDIRSTSVARDKGAAMPLRSSEEQGRGGEEAMVQRLEGLLQRIEAVAERLRPT
jgi:cell division protein ZapA